MILLAGMALALAFLYAALTFANLGALRAPPDAGDAPPLSVLIPARDEAANIGPAIDAALAGAPPTLEVVVLDDHSTDATAAIVAAHPDARVRLIRGAALPAGWNGKQFACAQLAEAARHDLLMFVDADVRLAPRAPARIAAFMARHDLDFASGFPRQLTHSLAERLVIPEILVLLLGYLPLAMARRSPSPGFAAACGQLMAVRRAAYVAAGGHGTFRASRHDGLKMPRAIRAAGGRTDLFDGTDIATCRMYEGAAAVWRGFGKNATEGMATPGALPVWTVLLAGGHVVPFVLLVTTEGMAFDLAFVASTAVFAARTALALRMRQPAVSVLLHPLGIVATLAIQWSALVAAARGRAPVWRGRSV